MICDDCDTVAYCKKYGCVPKQPTSEHPASKSFVGLTDEEIDKIYEAHHNQYGECETPNFGYERDIEAKLREKNG